VRTLVLLLIAALCASGPFLYVTRGAAARERRRIAAERLIEAHEAVQALIRQDKVTPTVTANRVARAQVEANTVALRKILDEAATIPADPPTVLELRAFAAAAGVDGSLIQPLLAGMNDGPGDRVRRLGLSVVLDLIATGDHLLRSVSIANAAKPIGKTPLSALRVDLTVVSPPADVVALTESLLAGSETRPRADISSIEISTLSMDELERLGRENGSPPVQGRIAVDILLARDLPSHKIGGDKP